ncbi:MAG: sulfite exporter TauE/SafE family protein, partial [Ignavibacteria bacterium]|nr:sulfite exporter TauE/SafE family protein [Ignavibacteria bacterium]
MSERIYNTVLDTGQPDVDCWPVYAYIRSACITPVRNAIFPILHVPGNHLMDYIIVGFIAFAAAGLTLFSGFGLGTILLPAMALFFPVEVAVSLTAIVHFLNNLLKLGLFARHVVREVLVPFGLTAIPSAFLGAFALIWLAGRESLVVYSILGRSYMITPLNVVMAAMMIAFALAELLPRFRNLSFRKNLLPVGGMLSGFFGGLSGHQGALRSAFLVRTGLTREQFIGTGVVIACLVDLTRLTTYGNHLSVIGREEMTMLFA